MPLINWEINLILTCSENCVLTSKATKDAVPAQRGNPAVTRDNNPTNAIFKITGTKLYVPVVTLSTSKSGFKELLNGINIDQKWLIRLKLIT